MRISTAPRRVRSLASWLLGKTALASYDFVSRRLTQAGAHRYHYVMLAALEEFGSASQATLGRRCGLDRSDVAAGVADLAEWTLVERAVDPDDRRRKTVRLTDAGRRRLEELDRLVAAAQEEFLVPLSPDERRHLIALLTRLADHHGVEGEG